MGPKVHKGKWNSFLHTLFICRGWSRSSSRGSVSRGEVGGVLGAGEVLSSMEGVEAPLESPSLVSNLSFVEVDVLPATSMSTIIL